MPAEPCLSVVIPCRREAANIATCIHAFDTLKAEGSVEVIVVDNFSDDGTADLAREAGARVFMQGPERCAQRNRGWREARGRAVMFVDADMIVPEETQREILSRLEAGAEALYVREVRTGGGWWTKARNFERSFYDATCIDGIRVMTRTRLEETGGYDETLVACEDWDLDRRLKALGCRTELTHHALLHNEKRLTFSRHLAKKRYYAGTFDAYRRKWGDDDVMRRQFGLVYRFFGVFTENGKWKRLVRHPILFATILGERFAVGLLFLLRSARN